MLKIYLFGGFIIGGVEGCWWMCLKINSVCFGRWDGNLGSLELYREEKLKKWE